MDFIINRTKAPSPINQTFAAGLFQLKGNKEQRWKPRRKLLEKRLQSESLMATNPMITMVLLMYWIKLKQGVILSGEQLQSV